MKTLRWAYKILRSVIFSAILIIAGIFTFLYVSVAIPPVQKILRERAVKELSTFLGSKIEIDNLTIKPVNEVIIEGLHVYDLEGKECLEVNRLGAGINLWRLIFSGEIEITFVELLDFQAQIYQKTQDSPLNINFIIEAFAPKDKNKPPTQFDLKIHNVVIRGGNVSFSRLWKPAKQNGTFDANHIKLENFSADITLPRVSNEETFIDLRRLSFNEGAGLQVKDLSGIFGITGERISIRNFSVRLPQTEIKTADFDIPTSIFKDKSTEGNIDLKIFDSRITPSNLASFYPALESIDVAFPFALSATGNMKHISVNSFDFGSRDNIHIGLKGSLDNYLAADSISVQVDRLDTEISSDFAKSLLPLMGKASENQNLSGIIANLGHIDIEASGKYSSQKKRGELDSKIMTSVGQLLISGAGGYEGKAIDCDVRLSVPELDLTGVIPNFPLEKIADANIDFKGAINLENIKNSGGDVGFNIGDIQIKNRNIAAIQGELTKNGKLTSLLLSIDDYNLNGSLEASVFDDGANTRWLLDARLNDFDTYNSYLTEEEVSGYEIKGEIKADATGNSIDNITGELLLSDFSIKKASGQQLAVSHLSLNVTEPKENLKTVSIESDIVDFNLTGDYTISTIPVMVKRTLAEICPAVFPPYFDDRLCGSGKFEISVKDAEPLIQFFNLPIFPLTELSVDGSFDSLTDNIRLETEIPYIQQGSNKLITGTYFDADITGKTGSAILKFGTVYPTKKGLLKLDIDLQGTNGEYDVAIDFNKGRNVSFYGDIALKILLEKNPVSNKLNASAFWLPSQLYLNEALWNVEEAEIRYSETGLAVRDFCIRHDDQFVSIAGNNNFDGNGVIKVELSRIDLDYLFETLNIPHVTFGGTATGEITAQDIFSPDPDIRTQKLIVDNLSYNGGLIGNGDLRALLNLPAKEVEIGGIIREDGRRVATVDGGVWFGRDSLSFAFDADRVNIEFMQPFMSAFSSSVKGRASGNALLFGNFSDIDMTGTIVAQDAQILIDYINTYYSGSDTVYLKPGRIEIPHFTVSDKFGNTAVVEGELTHRYFHEPAFRFRINEVDKLLVYNTDAKINPIWYGTVFASGAGEVSGRPGFVNIAADMETEPGTDFTFVLSDQQEAVKSHFLTFTDKRKAAAEAAAPKDTVPEFLHRFMKQQQNQEGTSDVFSMDLRVSVTDDAKLNLIMDPVAGDKITAFGTGAMNMTYTSLTDELKLYGKYILDKGTYNFSLQDIILKEFIIKPGSSIAFTGNPYNGILDITGAYRVNTSLTELDRSFANDRELNRTSVPVEALLHVTGVLTSPHIAFDIDLPTVTEETAQKVRSIISTDDMMSRQVLYLVALNKFYPPEYMSTSNSGGEWASVASSTISSQIQNVIGQITDKFTLSPSIRSDKGDFSDVEVDVALSSQLFDNRLLINGNIGYRDPSNSSTTFVGDFDLEYLLNKKGTWRLKAYNHFNDQNYYLKSALTTQGLGIIWRTDFGIPRKKEEKSKDKDNEKDAKKQEDVESQELIEVIETGQK